MPSVGFIGSWFRSCATRSFMNMFLSTAPRASAAAGTGGALLSDVNGGRRIAIRIAVLSLCCRLHRVLVPQLRYEKFHEHVLVHCAAGERRRRYGRCAAVGRQRREENSHSNCCPFALLSASSGPGSAVALREVSSTCSCPLRRGRAPPPVRAV